MIKFFTQLFRIVIALLVSSLAAQAQTSGSKKVNPMEAQFIEFVKSKHPDFRIVKKIEPFPERYNASVELPIKASTPSGSTTERALVTLHDAVTGEPMESCYTPCSLHKSPGRPVFVFPYKFGHFTFPSKIEADPLEMHEIYPYWGDEYQVRIGPDFRKAHLQGKLCEAEFAKMEKTDRDAMPCYRMPPHAPPINYSGYCKTAFDITPKGKVTNARVTECSDKVFEISSLVTVRAWKYHPKIERGVAVSRPGVQTRLRYDITDFDGTLLDENGNRIED